MSTSCEKKKTLHYILL